MTYEKIVEKLQKTFGKAKADKIEGHVAVQFNVTGEGEGALYIEIEDGKVDVQPYEYYDNNAVITVPSDVLIDIVDGKLDIETAYNEQKLYVDGDLGAALVIKNLSVKKAPAKKATTTKKAAAPKAEKKAPAKKATTTKKAAAPKAEAKVEEAPKAEKKAPAKKATTTKKAATTKTTATKTTAAKKTATKSTTAKKTTKTTK